MWRVTIRVIEWDAGSMEILGHVRFEGRIISSLGRLLGSPGLGIHGTRRHEAR